MAQPMTIAVTKNTLPMAIAERKTKQFFFTKAPIKLGKTNKPIAIHV